MHIRDYQTPQERRKALEEALRVSLQNTASYTLSEEIASTRHCENMIGATQVPVGVAGPLSVLIGNMKADYFLPLATTEGALVASVSRGCKAINESGGVIVRVEKLGVTRAPVFEVQNLQEGEMLTQWVADNFSALQKIAQTTSHHLTLLSATPFSAGRNVYIRFQYDTEDAMGMNMATFATEEVVKHITQETKIACVSVSGNVCVDKKASHLNFLYGRGYKVWAEVKLPRSVVEDVLKTTIADFHITFERKVLYGSIMTGSLGFNAQYANILAAIFLATGQDLGHIAECAIGVTTAEVVEDMLYVSVYLPDLLVGTVGGGTELATQQEALSLLGVQGGNGGKNAKQFAGIIGGAVLAGEISLLASLSSGTLGSAHKALARKKL